jgi:hypothetical protein
MMQFTVADLFVVTLACALGVCWIKMDRQRQNRAADAAQRFGLTVEWKPRLPGWLREWAGDEPLGWFPWKEVFIWPEHLYPSSADEFLAVKDLMAVRQTSFLIRVWDENTVVADSCPESLAALDELWFDRPETKMNWVSSPTCRPCNYCPSISLLAQHHQRPMHCRA